MILSHGVSVSQSVTRLRLTKIAERIDVLFGVETFGGSRNFVLNGSRYFHTGREVGKC